VVRITAPDGEIIEKEAAIAARDEVINLVNNFFYEKLTALPPIKVYIDSVQGKS
jgi:hypothetical protein